MRHIEALKGLRKSRPSSGWNSWRAALLAAPVILAAQMVGLGVFHEPEVNFSTLREEGACLRFDINNLLQEELVMEGATLRISASIDGGFTVSNPMPLLVAGAPDAQVLLQPGDKRSICFGFPSAGYRQELVRKLKKFTGLTDATCRFRIVVRTPGSWTGQFYARAFDCAAQLPSLFR